MTAGGHLTIYRYRWAPGIHEQERHNPSQANAVNTLRGWCCTCESKGAKNGVNVLQPGAVLCMPDGQERKNMTNSVKLQSPPASWEAPPVKPLDEAVWRTWVLKGEAQDRRGSASLVSAVKYVSA